MMAADNPMSTGKPLVKRQCTAKSKRTHERCQRPCLPGREVCYHHGGKSPKGVASPNYIHGIYVELPAAMHEDYLRVKADPNFLSVAGELHILRTMAVQLVSGLNGDVVSLGRDLGVAWDGFQTAKAGGNVPRMKEAMARFEQVIDEAKGTTAKVNGLITLFDNIRKLSDTETKRIVLAKEMLTREQAQLFAGLVQAAVVESIGVLDEPGDRQKVLAAFTDNMVRIQVGGLK